jgi:hypothetical protein
VIYYLMEGSFLNNAAGAPQLTLKLFFQVRWVMLIACSNRLKDSKLCSSTSLDILFKL